MAVLNGETGSSTFNVYPLPAASELVFELLEEIENNSVLKLFDITGQIINEYKVNQGKNRLNLELISNGIYLYKIESSKKIFSGKIIISK